MLGISGPEPAFPTWSAVKLLQAPPTLSWVAQFPRAPLALGLSLAEIVLHTALFSYSVHTAFYPSS